MARVLVVSRLVYVLGEVAWLRGRLLQILIKIDTDHVVCTT